MTLPGRLWEEAGEPSLTAQSTWEMAGAQGRSRPHVPAQPLPRRVPGILSRREPGDIAMTQSRPVGAGLGWPRPVAPR